MIKSGFFYNFNWLKSGQRTLRCTDKKNKTFKWEAYYFKTGVKRAF